MKLYIGVDIALRKSGYVVLDEQMNIIQREVVVIPDKLDYTSSVYELFEKFTTLFKALPAGAELHLVVEDVLAFVHIKSALAIHAARTACILAWHHAHTSNRNIAYHTPNSVKYWLTKKRGAKKPDVLAAMQAKYPQYAYDTFTEDEVDALALVLYHLEEESSVKPVPKPKRRRVSK